MKAAIIRLALHLLTDKKTRDKIILLAASIAVGFFCLLAMPVIVLMTMDNMEAPEITLDESDLLSSIDSEQIAAFESAGQEIADALAAKGLQEQILKAQLIYFSCFEEGQITDFEKYANAFQIPDDQVVIGYLNTTYGLDIVYEDFARTYALVLNATINEYLFTSAETKNSADLAAWCRNAYESEWLYQSGGYGEMDETLRRRTADNAGLILGYLNYDPAEKVFGNSTDTLLYTVQGDKDTMPDAEGLGVFTGSELGIYGGDGSVFFASADGGCVEKVALSDEQWVSWCTFEGIDYPQEVWDAVYAIQHPTEEETTEETKEVNASDHA